MGDAEDHAKFLQEFGITERHLSAALADESDIIPFPFDCAGDFAVAESDIHGVGVFSRRRIRAGAVYAPARLHGHRTPGGRFVNHAKEPNSKFVMQGGDLYLAAVKEIAPGDELTLDYRQALTESMRSQGQVVDLPAHTVIAAGDQRESLERAMSPASVDARAHAFDLERAINERIGENTMEVLPGPIRHYFADGVYVRALFLKAGSFIVGKVHRHDHIAVMLCGDITIVDTSGHKRIKGPALPFISHAGVKRAAIVHADTWFLNIHGRRDHGVTDVSGIEEYYVCNTESEFREFAGCELGTLPVIDSEGSP